MCKIRSDHRHRKTEVEEDTELMNVEGDEEEVLFTESPSCKNNEKHYFIFFGYNRR